MVKVTVEEILEDLWSWWMVIMAESKLFRNGSCNLLFAFLRYTQTAVASFGPRRQYECGLKPAGFTRLTPEVLDWVKKTAQINHSTEIKGQGKLFIVKHFFFFSFLTTLFQPC